MTTKLISRSGLVLLDCDEVLLEWFPAFAPFAERELGRRLCPDGPGQFDMSGWLGFSDRAETIRLIRIFNDSDASGSDALSPLPGAVSGVHTLLDLGYNLKVVTSFSDDPLSIRRRCDNLERIFGRDAFDDVISTPLGASKRDILAGFPPSAWIDDLPGNVLAGHAAGHASAVMDSHHNISERETFRERHGLPWFLDWEEIVRSLSPDQVPEPC